MEKLQQIYESYLRELEKVTADAPAYAGIWGMGEDPRNHPCNMRFYEAVQEYLQQLPASEADEETLYQAVRWVLSAPAQYRDHAAYWYMYAAHGLCAPLVDRLSGEHCAQLRQLYDAEFPKRDRMPVQEKLYKQLKKAAGRKGCHEKA